MTLRIATVVVLVLYRRFRHLVVFLATLVVTDWLVVRVLAVELPAYRAGPGRRRVVRVPVQGDLHPGHHDGGDELRPRGPRPGTQLARAGCSPPGWFW